MIDACNQIDIRKNMISRFENKPYIQCRILSGPRILLNYSKRGRTKIELKFVPVVVCFPFFIYHPGINNSTCTDYAITESNGISTVTVHGASFKEIN